MVGMTGQRNVSTSDQLPERLVLYDGACGLCHHAVRALLKRDRQQRLWFAPLQGETAGQVRTRHPELPTDLSSVAYVDSGRLWLRSAAFFRMARALPYPSRAASWLWIIPRPLTDLVYRGVAAIRYRVWGELETCSLPSPEQRARFLD